MKKNIYPAVYMNLMRSSVVPGRETLTMDTYLRKKHRGKYYLWHFFKERDIDSAEGRREFNILMEIEQFHGEVYRTMHLGKINLRIVDPRVQDRSIFELDPDQRSEEERLLEGVKW